MTQKHYVPVETEAAKKLQESARKREGLRGRGRGGFASTFAPFAFAPEQAATFEDLQGQAFPGDIPPFETREAAAERIAAVFPALALPEPEAPFVPQESRRAMMARFAAEFPDLERQPNRGGITPFAPQPTGEFAIPLTDAETLFGILHLLEEYHRGVIEPLASLATTTVQEQILPGQQEIERRAAEFRRQGMSSVEAATRAYRESDLPAGVKGAIELGVDPINLAFAVGPWMRVSTQGARRIAPKVVEAARPLTEGLKRVPTLAEEAVFAKLPRGLGRPADLVDDWVDAMPFSDPGPPGVPSQRGGRPPTIKGGGEPPTQDPIDDVFERVRQQRTRDEAPEVTLLRRHEGAINTAENEARILVDQANKRLRMNIGAIRQGRLVPRQEDIAQLDELFDVLHNPSKVASGEMAVPQGLEAEYATLRRLTDWEEAMRLDFDPAMATVSDYFYRGWLPPKEAVSSPTGLARGQLGARPAFKKPRVDATFREMRDAGFEPLSWNPYEQWRISRLQGVRYRQQMQLIDDLKKMELAKTDASGIGVEGWRTPKVGPAFEGKPFATTDAAGEPVAMYSRRWVVPDELANRFENIYGTSLNLGKVHVGKRGIELMQAIDTLVFIPKRAKLFGSLFQQMDFLTRSYVGAWSGMVDALMAGQPIEAVTRLAVWPKTAIAIVEANFSPGARAAIRQQLNSTTPLIPGRPGIHLRGIMEAGLSTIDTTLLPRNLDAAARVVATEAGLLGNKAVRRAIASLESTMRRGLFEGVYPAAQITDIKNNLASIIVRRYGKGLSDEALNGMIAKATNKKYSTIPASQSVIQNRFLREALRRLLFSMGESEGLLRQATGALRGPEAGFWRTHWVGAYLGLIALANAIHFASTGEPLPFSRWTPISKYKWGPFPVGYNQEFAAPNIPVRDTEGRQLTLDLVGQLDTAFRILDPSSFLSSRESVPIRAAATQINERDYFGRPIDQVGPGGIYSRTANLINDLFTPIGPGQAAAQIALQTGTVPQGLIPGSEARLGVHGQLLQAPGLNLRAQIGHRWDDEVQEYMDIPTDTKAASGLVTRGQYRKLHPDIDAKLFIRRDVTSLLSLEAMEEAARIITEDRLDPDLINGIKSRKTEKDKGRKNYVDLLIEKLEAGAEPPPGLQPLILPSRRQEPELQPELQPLRLPSRRQEPTEVR